ncbi:hypothetical protein SAMN04487972_102294 [Paracoccus halophilus]|uniref:Uncharacterized protein n=1 Tax=Paracoccus halophilus TaxID=376733 RepID=A0A099F9A1_9RHOB|nr:hypothetical protein [Paracoccus halophilus]KGJ06662.1 hypothetical protein IT41_00315 [Paracoccus halophilus]SFA42361.1 hypothetical protein SAMN04487972_102294 [Paracoccus halophilus]
MQAVSGTGPAAQPLPGADALLRAGLSGAAIAGTWAGIHESGRLRNGDIASDEAVQATLNSAMIGAGAAVVAQVVGHAARAVPLLALAVAAGGVLYLANRRWAEAAADSGG